MGLTFGIFCPIHSGGFAKRESTNGQDPTWEEAKRVTLLAEALGFEYDLIAARWYGPVLEPYTTTAGLASITTQIKLIVAVHSGLIQPQVVAKIGANIDQISGGRFHVNRASGAEDHDFQHRMYGGEWLEHDERYAQSEEYVHILKGLWFNHPYSYDGEYYHVKDVDLQPKTVQRPYPATFIGGRSDAARDVAARELDWFFIGGSPLEEMLEIKADVTERAAKHGRTLRFAVMGLCMVRDSDAEAAKEIAALTEQAETDRTVRVYVNSLKAGLWGTPERIAGKLAELERNGFEMVLFQSRSMGEDLTRFGEQVVPMLSTAPPTGEGPRFLTVQG